MGLDLVAERDFWTTNILHILIPIPKQCNNCNKDLINLCKNNSINNPYLGKWNFYKCNHEIYLRIGTIFEFNNKTHVSLLYNIIILWLHDELNASKISVKLKEIYKLKAINMNFIYNFYKS